MSTDIGGLVDRVYREYLEPMDDVVSYTTLTTGINDSVTSVVFNGDLLSVEEEDALDAGSIIEIGQELMICTDLNTVTNTITVTRGARGTTKVAHTASNTFLLGKGGDIFMISPAVCADAVVPLAALVTVTVFVTALRSLHIISS